MLTKTKQENNEYNSELLLKTIFIKVAKKLIFSMEIFLLARYNALTEVGIA